MYIHQIYFSLVSFSFIESQKIKSNTENAQTKSNNTGSKLNGEERIPSDNDIKNDNLRTKEPNANGTDESHENIVNGDAKKHSDCDISSSSDNTKVVSNGISSDSDDSKSTKSDEGQEVILPKACPNKNSESKQVSDKKKENKKTKTTTDKSIVTGKKDLVSTDSAEKKDEDPAKDGEAISDKVNGECSKVVNGDKDRESSPSEDGDEKKRDAEVVFIQDMGFTVQIVSPGAEPLDIQVNFSPDVNEQLP